MSKREITIKSTKLKVYQKEVWDGIKAHQTDAIHVVLSPRQMGKSYLIEMLLYESCINHSNQISIVIQPTLAQARKMASEMAKMIEKTPVYKGYNQQLLELRIGSSQILFKSSEQGEEAIRGYTISKWGYLVVDEAAYCSDSMFYSATPLCNAKKANILLFSTPRWKSGFFYQFFNGKFNNVYTYDWSRYENPFLTPDKLELIRATMPTTLFLADYKGKWMENTSETFGNFMKVIGKGYNPQNLNRIMGVDFGVGKNAENQDSDFTVCSVFNSEREQVALERWNDMDETQTINKIVDTAVMHHVSKLVVEENSIGKVYLGLLRKEIVRRKLKLVVTPFNTNNKSKNEIIENFVVLVQNEMVSLLDNPEQRLEMTVYQAQKTTTGKQTYNAQYGYHDDCVMATAIALYGMSKGTYAVR